MDLRRLVCIVSPRRWVASPPPPRRLGGTYLVGCPPGAAEAGAWRAGSFAAEAAAVKGILLKS